MGRNGSASLVVLLAFFVNLFHAGFGKLIADSVLN